MTTSDGNPGQDSAAIQAAQADMHDTDWLGVPGSGSGTPEGVAAAADSPDPTAATPSAPPAGTVATMETAPTSTLPAIPGAADDGNVLPAAGQIVTCPECGTAAVVSVSRRDSTDFCRNCDFPLFCAPSEVMRGDGLEAGDASLRRLPGTVGQVSVAQIICPVCSEPNAVTAKVCVRCGSSLTPVPLPAPPPAPVVVAAPPPAPEPEPEPERGIPWWVWVVIAVAVTALLVVIAVLNTH
jgi:hypothetical protein